MTFSRIDPKDAFSWGLRLEDFELSGGINSRL
jgi:hypothetical protein